MLHLSSRYDARTLRDTHCIHRFTTQNILREFLPNQSMMLLASPLVDNESTVMKQRLRNHVRFHGKRSSPTHIRSQKGNRRCALLEPLSDSSGLNRQFCSGRSHPVDQYRKHTLKMWENKLSRNDLSIEDALFLLLHEDIVKVTECILMIKTSQMTSDQVMEVEMALEQIDHASGTAEIPFPNRVMVPPLCHTISRSVWKYGVAFHYQQIQQPEIAHPSKRYSELRSPVRHVHPAISPQLQSQSLTAFCSLADTNCQSVSSRLRNEFQNSQLSLLRHSKYVMYSASWIRDHCLEEIEGRRSPLFQSMRKTRALEIIVCLTNRRVSVLLTLNFRRWRTNSLARACDDAVKRYCRLKCAAKVLSLARCAMKRSFTRHWCNWPRRVRLERKLENLAAAVTIQSWMRVHLSKRYVAHYHIERAATKLQASWRGYICRRLVTRRRRYTAYTSSACVVQRVFRAYRWRSQFEEAWRRHRASLCITRNIRRYCARRRLFRSWCDRVARFHAAAIIQVWIRTELHRVRDSRNLMRRQYQAARTLQHFFRYVRFVLFFGSRLQTRIRKRQAAAVTLQNAYRSKQARARFYALKDELEARRRQQILEMMWHNAYATTIQRWWRSHQAEVAAPSE